jgi:hypothetical protein
VRSFLDESRSFSQAHRPAEEIGREGGQARGRNFANGDAVGKRRALRATGMEDTLSQYPRQSAKHLSRIRIHLLQSPFVRSRFFLLLAGTGRGSDVTGKNLVDGLHEPILRNSELGVGAKPQVIGAVLVGGGELGAEQ